MNIEFIIPTYNRTNHLKTMICSLLAQTSSNWKAHIVADNPPEDINNENIKFVEFLNDDRIRYTKLDKRYNDWGHTPRNYGLKHSTEDYIVMTGEDNYYMPLFVEDFLKAVYDKSIHFVYCNMVHNLTSNSYMPMVTKFDLGWIDIGCCMYERKFINDLLLDTKIPESDYYFIMKYVTSLTHSFMPIIKIDKILYVHN